MEIKNKHVAISYDNSGNCEFIATVKVINDRELNRLKNEKEKLSSEKQQKELELKEKVDANQEKIKHLLKKDLLLAKAIYDKFVDRGYIDENKDFDKEFFEYIYNDQPFARYPEEFAIILRKVESL